MELDNVLRQLRLQHADLARRDVGACLNSFKDLHPAPDSFTFSDGVSRRVLSLTGTVPVLYSGTTYNIPIALYLLDTHPYHPPVCYVRPTAEMVVKASKHVDSHGRIYLPYLSEWSHPKCNLEALVQILVLLFQDSCPVFARSTSTSSGGSAASLPYPTAGGGAGMPQPGLGGGGGGGGGERVPPPRPPYPYSTQGSSGTIGPEAIRASVLSALEERLRGRMSEAVGGKWAEVESLRRTGDELERGGAKISGLLTSLRAEEAELRKATEEFSTKAAEMESAVSAASNEGEGVSLDEAIGAATVLHRQLVDNFVQDAAIEDAVYYLGQGLAQGRLELDSFLREVRKLSRQQFNARATVLRCRRKANLP